MRISFILIAVMLLIACHNASRKSSGLIPKTYTDSVFSNLLSVASAFSISENSAFPDSNELYFYFAHRFDTSLLLHIKKNDSLVKVLAYEVTMPYFKVDPVAADGQLPQFFEGYSFYITLSEWMNIANAADSILLSPEGPPSEYVAFDSPTCFLVFNSKIKRNLNDEETKRLEAFLDYLKHEILYQQLAKKPKWFLVPE